MFGIHRNRSAQTSSPADITLLSPVPAAHAVFSSESVLAEIQQKLPARDKKNFHAINKTAHRVDNIEIKAAARIGQRIKRLHGQSENALEQWTPLCQCIEQLPVHLQNAAWSSMASKLGTLRASIYANALHEMQTRTEGMETFQQVVICGKLKNSIFNHLEKNADLHRYYYARPQHHSTFSEPMQAHGNAFIAEHLVLEKRLRALMEAPDIAGQITAASDEEIRRFLNAQKTLFLKGRPFAPAPVITCKNLSAFNSLAARLQHACKEKKADVRIKEYLKKTGVIAYSSALIPVAAFFDPWAEPVRMADRLNILARTRNIRAALGDSRMSYLCEAVARSCVRGYNRVGNVHSSPHKELFLYLKKSFRVGPYQNSADRISGQQRAPGVASLLQQLPFLKPGRQAALIKLFQDYFAGLREVGTPDHPSQLTQMAQAHAESIYALAAALPALQESGSAGSISKLQKVALSELHRLTSHLSRQQIGTLNMTLQQTLDSDSMGDTLRSAIENLMAGTRS